LLLLLCRFIEFRTSSGKVMERIAGGRPRDPPQHTSECRPCRDMLLAVCKKRTMTSLLNALSLAQAKEGPSAGITILVGMVSALTKKACEM